MKTKWMDTKKALSYLRRGSKGKRGIKHLDAERLREDGRYEKFGYITKEESPYGEALVEVYSASVYYRRNPPEDRTPDPDIKKSALLLKRDGCTHAEIACTFNKTMEHGGWSIDDIRRLFRRGPDASSR